MPAIQNFGLLVSCNNSNQIGGSVKKTFYTPLCNQLPIYYILDVELNFNHHIALLCNKAGRQINALSRLSNVLNVDTKMLILQSFILSHFMYCCIIWHFCSISDTKKIEKMQLKALRHI